MNQMRALLTFSTLVTLALCVPAHSAKVTIVAGEFPDEALININTAVQGFRFSPNCHYDAANEDFGVFIGIDSAGCEPDGLFNPDFLGPEEYALPDCGESCSAVMYIDAGGHPFSLLEVQWFRELESLTSSKGGSYSRREDELTTWSHDFSGGAWRGIRWLLWEYANNPGEPVAGFTSWKFSRVSEPGSLALLGLGLAGLGLSRRRKAG